MLQAQSERFHPFTSPRYIFKHIASLVLSLPSVRPVLTHDGRDVHLSAIRQNVVNLKDDIDHRSAIKRMFNTFKINIPELNVTIVLHEIQPTPSPHTPPHMPSHF